MHFFRGDPWLSSIEEFQPMFRDASRLGTDLANLGGGVAALLLTRRRGIPLVFAIGYTLLAISSRRFLVPGIAMFVIAGAIAALDRKWLAIALTLLPPLAYDVYAFTHPEPPDNPAPFVVASEIRPLPPGRVLAPWYLGHAIDVFGRHAVVIDNFGSMPDARRFEMANDALTNRHHDQLLDYCRRNGVRYLANDRAPSWHGFPQIAPHVWLCSSGEHF
jgi:hypothetical protein